uniref:Histone acetyltransferase HPA2 and related acetyltransferases n=1 Tax=uncultured Thiotrichaceae bacterium TaxID=298394 RepID=A0A6S6TCP7_9GAMM|nr:MAG: Histone acetyltransferase HPA2 and related acetyltransferases [uncultured Thiotrichaceae bacterium]
MWMMAIVGLVLFIIGQQGFKYGRKALLHYHRKSSHVVRRKEAMDITIEVNGDINEAEVIDIYRANKWSSAEKPEQLLPALRHSHTLITARQDGVLVGLANAISDGHLVVYYPHILVHPDHHGKGVGRKMVASMQSIYSGYHQQMLTADGDAIDFYKALGFERAGKTEPMWKYAGTDH